MINIILFWLECAVATTAPQDDAVIFLREASAYVSKSPARDSVSLGIVAAFVRAGHVDDALRIADGRKDAFRAIMVAQANSGDLEGALRTADLLDDPSNKIQAIIFVAGHRAQSGDVQGGIRLVESELKEKADRITALRFIARAQRDGGDIAGAIRTYEAIKTPHDQARARRLEALELIKKGDFAGALRCAEEIRHLIRQENDERNRSKKVRGQASMYGPPLDPNDFWDSILEEIALAQAMAGDSTRAIKSAEAIRAPYNRSYYYAKIASIIARAGDKATATILIARALELADVSRYRGFELSEIAKAQALIGEIEISRKNFLRALRTVGAEINQNLVVLAEVQSGDIEGALQTAAVISDPTAKRLAMEHIAAAQTIAGDVAGAIQEAMSFQAADDQARLLLRISEAQAAAGHKKEASATLRRTLYIKDPFDGEVLRSLTKTLTKLGDVDSAMELVSKKSALETRAQALLGIAEGKLPDIKFISQGSDFN